MGFPPKSALWAKADSLKVTLYKTIVCEHVFTPFNQFQLSNQLTYISIFVNLEKKPCKKLLRIDFVHQENEFT